MGLFDGLFRRSRRTTEPQVTAQLPDHPQRRGLTFQVGNIQGVGGRERQEDSFALLHAADAGEIARRGLFAVVADGMGGLEDGKQISEGAVDTLLQLFQALNDEGDIPRQLKEGICAVSDGLFQRFAGRSGTTVVAVRIFQDGLHWVSVGDSAIYLMRGGGVFRIEDVQYAVVETTGKVNILQKFGSQTLTADMIGLNGSSGNPPVTLISDGKIIGSAMEAAQLERRWLDHVLKKEGLLPQEIFLMTADEQKSYCIIPKCSVRKGAGK